MPANPTSDQNPIMPASNNDLLPGDSLPTAVPRCPTCGEMIPPSAPVGLCPKCALLGVADLGESGPTVTAAYASFQAPTIAEIAAKFPQLEILELIGHGGMGAVYRARQPHLERTVALKVLPKSLAAAPEFTERFTREARMLARLAHPNIVGIFDFGESGDRIFRHSLEIAFMPPPRRTTTTPTTAPSASASGRIGLLSGGNKDTFENLKAWRTE